MAPLIYADFHNADVAGRIRLNTVGTLEDIADLRIELEPGMEVTLYADDGDSADGLKAEGKVEYDPEAGWVATIDWSAFRSVAPPLDQKLHR